MVIVKLYGGLGNQLFQYATARAVARRAEVNMCVDLSSYRKDRLRNFELYHWNIPLRHASTLDYLRTGLSPSFVKILRRFPRLSSSSRRYLREKSLHLDSRCFNPPKKLVLDGYWQHAAYFDDIRETLLKEFTLKDEMSETLKNILKLIVNVPSVGLHIRRGDYVSNPATQSIHGMCDQGYYRRAVDTMRQFVGDCHFFVFSDDIAWVRENSAWLNEYPITLIQPNPQRPVAEDLYLMSQCQHQIIANSTFSWWAAWMNRYPKKKIIGPSRWYQKKEFSELNPMLPTWTRV